MENSSETMLYAFKTDREIILDEFLNILDSLSPEQKGLPPESPESESEIAEFTKKLLPPPNSAFSATSHSDLGAKTIARGARNT